MIQHANVGGGRKGDRDGVRVGVESDGGDTVDSLIMSNELADTPRRVVIGRRTHQHQMFLHRKLTINQSINQSINQY